MKSIKYTLYFEPKITTVDDIQQLLKEHKFEGSTILAGKGVFQDVQEECAVLVLIAPLKNEVELDERVTRLATFIRLMNEQSCVLIEKAFVEAFGVFNENK